MILQAKKKKKKKKNNSDKSGSKYFKNIFSNQLYFIWQIIPLFMCIIIIFFMKYALYLNKSYNNFKTMYE